MMMMSFGAMATIGVVWVLWGYSEAFGDSWHGLVGNPFQHFRPEQPPQRRPGDLRLRARRSPQSRPTPASPQWRPSRPTAAFPRWRSLAFQAVFAIITVALISGAIADRAKFGTWMVFTVVWATVVYFPVANWGVTSPATPPPGWLDRQSAQGD